MGNIRNSIFTTAIALAIGAMNWLGTSLPGASAAIVNGGFEQNDPIGWQFFGVGSIVPTSTGYGIAPEGGRHAVIESSSDFVASGIADLENFLSLTPNSLTTLGFNNLAAGSAIRQDISANAGDVLSFQWNFLTFESPGFGSPSDVDFAFFSIANDSGPQVLSTTLNPDLSAVTGVYPNATGYSVFEYTFQTSGDFRIGFGVVDVNGVFAPSALLIDDVRLLEGDLSVIPEPAFVSLVWISLSVGGVAVYRRRQTRRRNETLAKTL